MALVIPEVILLKVLNALLDIVRDDYNDNVALGTEQDSILYSLFGGLTMDEYNLYDNAKAVIITTPENPKHIDAIKLTFPTAQSSEPVIVLNCPGENTTNNSLGLGSGDNDEIIYNNPYPTQDDQRPTFNRRWTCTYYLMFFGESRSEMLILYNLFKSLIVMAMESTSVMGIENLKIGGQDLTSYIQIPDKVFRKAITLNFEYENKVPALNRKKIYDKLLIYWKLNQATVRNGPILVESDDSDSDTFD